MLRVVMTFAGVKTDGMSKYFFFLPSKAYPTEVRKRRNIEIGPGISIVWHKTDNTMTLKVDGG